MTFDTDPDTIEQQLAETRGRLDARLEQLERRLSPSQLIDNGFDYLRHGQGAEFVRNLGADLRDNPMPVAVAGIGLAWLMSASALSGNRSDDASRMAGRTDTASAGRLYDDMAVRAQQAGDALSRLADEGDEAFRTRVAEARAQILGMQRDASETASVFIERVQQALDRAQQEARDRLEQMRQAGSEWGAAVADQTRHAGDAVGQAAQQGREFASRAGATIAEAIDQNPLLLGALGLAAGVLLAAFMPPTEQEKDMVAPAAGAIRRAAATAIDRGERAAEAAAEAAYGEIAGQ